MWKDYVDIFSALLTPTIALITTYIAIQQYRRGRAKFRHELYDRRLAVFKAASNYLSIATRYGTTENFDEEEKAFREFLAANLESRFLFDKEDWLFLGLIHGAGMLRPQYRYMLKSGDPATVKKWEQHLTESTEKHREQIMRLQDVFVKYLDVKNLK